MPESIEAQDSKPQRENALDRSQSSSAGDLEP
jgi:hypothetical protein